MQLRFTRQVFKDAESVTLCLSTRSKAWFIDKKAFNSHLQILVPHEKEINMLR